MGFMALTDDVNTVLLNECFELRPFHGLCKAHADDLLFEPTSTISQADTHVDAEERGSNTIRMALFFFI